MARANALKFTAEVVERLGAGGEIPVKEVA